jgi:hypothetical protein
MAPLLHQRYLVLSLIILDANEDWFLFACYEDVFFLEYIDALFVTTESMPLSDVLPTLIRDLGKSLNVSACLDCADSLQTCSWVTYLALLVPPLATPTHHVDGLRIGRPALHWSCLLI